jgi:hypothetical protein
MWRYLNPRGRNHDLEPVRPDAGKEPPRTATGQPESPRCHYFQPGSYPPQTFATGSFSLHGFDKDQATLSGGDQQLLQSFAHELRKTFETYPESFVTIIGMLKRADAVASYLIAAGIPADKLRTTALDAGCSVEVKLFKRSLSYKPGAALTAKPHETAARPATVPFATLPGKFPGEVDEHRARAKEDSTVAAILADLHRKQADLPKGVRTPSEPLSKGAQHMAEGLGLPDWAVEKAREYGAQLPVVGLQTVLDQLNADKSMDDRERAALRKLITTLPRITE